MKSIGLSIIIILINFCISIAQESNKSKYIYQDIIVHPIDMTKFNEGGFEEAIKTSISNNDISKPIFKKTLLISPAFGYNVVYEFEKYTIIKFWPLSTNYKNIQYDQITNGLNVSGLLSIDPTKTTIKNDNFPMPIVAPRRKVLDLNTTFDLSNIYYIVETKELNSKSKEFTPIYHDLNIGFLFIPIKIRPFASVKGQFDFSSGFSAGPSVSLNLWHNWKKNHAGSLIFFTGISTFSADSSKLRESRKDYQISAFSPAIGFMFERNSIQLSIIGGFDFPSGTIQEKWVYRNQPWFGLGLGFGLFKIDNSNNNPLQKNKQ